MEEIKTYLKSNSPNKAKVVRFLCKIKDNIQKNPKNESFRKINPLKLLSKVEDAEILQFLLLGGFVYSEDGEWLILPLQNKFDSSAIDYAIQLQNPNYFQNQKLIEENKARILEERRKTREDRQQLSQRVEQAKQENATRRSNKSTAKELDFGRKDIDLKFNKKDPPGGGPPIMGGGG